MKSKLSGLPGKVRLWCETTSGSVVAYAVERWAAGSGVEYLTREQIDYVIDRIRVFFRM
jgi:hypothetical protein